MCVRDSEEAGKLGKQVGHGARWRRALGATEKTLAFSLSVLQNS